jgi:hypothetical protein
MREGLTKLPAEVEKSGRRKNVGHHFLDALIAHLSLIPRHSYPQTIYFLFSENNFIHTWETWLAACLVHCGYDIQVGYIPFLVLTNLLLQTGTGGQPENLLFKHKTISHDTVV